MEMTKGTGHGTNDIDNNGEKWTEMDELREKKRITKM